MVRNISAVLQEQNDYNFVNNKTTDKMDYQKITELLTKLVLLSRQESVHPSRRNSAADAAYLYSELIDRDVDSMHYKQIKSDFINAINNLKYDSREYIKALETKKDKQYEIFQ